MPHKKPSRRLITPLLLFTLAGWALWALGRNEPVEGSRTTEPVTDEPEREPELESTQARTRPAWSKRRLATSLAFVTLFFGGAAFSAGAGDVVVGALEGESTAEVTTGEQPAEEPTGEEPTEEPAPSDEPAPSEGEGEPAEEPADGEEPVESEEPADGEEPASEGEGEQTEGGGEPGESGEEGSDEPAPEGPAAPRSKDPVLETGTESPKELDPEVDAEGFFATIWLHRVMPDPTPPAQRLSPAFARRVAAEAKRAHVEWEAVLGVLRADGFSGRSLPARKVHTTARRLAALGTGRDEWQAFLAYRGRTTFADRATALTRYNRAVGLRALVTGLEAAKPSLQRSVLADGRLDIYPSGRLDVAMGRTDVRVLVLMRYLAEAHGQVTVSSLTTGHRLYSRPGVVSAHVYGLAVDVARLEGQAILGNQQVGGLTERAVRNILLLPVELRPKQVISLLGLGGPSFPLADHHDHIHVGY
jgi:hypothetical protein